LLKNYCYTVTAVRSNSSRNGSLFNEPEQREPHGGRFCRGLPILLSELNENPLRPKNAPHPQWAHWFFEVSREEVTLDAIFQAVVGGGDVALG